MKKQEFKKNERLRNLWDNFKCSNIRIIGMPEWEGEKQEIENYLKFLFEQIKKENFPNLEREPDMQVQAIQRVPKKLDPRRNTPRHITIKLPKIKDKDRILKAARRESYLQRSSITLSADFSKQTLQARRG